MALSVDSDNNLLFNGVPVVGGFTTLNTPTIELDLSASVLSANIALSSITNNDISSSAGIEYNKLNLSSSIRNSDVAVGAAIEYEKLDLTAEIIDADISAAAAISFNKLASLTSAHILVGNASNVATSVALTGDVTISNSGVTSYNGILPLSKGGSNKNLTPVQGGVVYTDADSMEITAAGTAGQFLKSNGSSAPAFASFTPPTVQKFATSGASGTYTLPAGCLYIQVEMIGAGGGGGGSGTTTSGGTGGAGGDTTFGTALLFAGGGLGGSPWSVGGAGSGGTASLGTGPVGAAVAGSYGAPGSNIVFSSGGPGGSSALGGAGDGATGGRVGGAGAAASGSGGGGAAMTSSGNSGGGGGSGGYIKATIYSPASSYSYAVGAAGSGGTAGASGFAGGAGGGGQIIVTEYYQ